MKDKAKMIRIIYYLTVALLVIIAAVRIFSIEDMENPTAEEQNYPGLGLYIAYIGMILVVLMWVANFVFKLITDPRSQLGAVAGAVVVAVIFFIAKASMPVHFEGMELADSTFVTTAVSSYSSAGLVTMYVIIGLAILSAVGTGIKTLFE